MNKKKKNKLSQNLEGRKEITKIRAKINEIEPRKTIEKLNETEFFFKR